MNLSRREFLILTASFTAGCGSLAGDNNPAASKAEIVVAGTASDYAADGVYTRFRDRGFFIVRDGDKLFAISAYCTHRRCKLTAETDHSFYCPCHGSTFTSGGHVTKGPARRDLPLFSTSVDENGQLLVKVSST
jgi:Rieske Fe-S protein